ncbi:MAG: DUF169 domain-containing protein [Spirochaetes bacterium]|nr:DUF169 domain-containing protein [Spirochaetota bacterium]
MSSKKQDIEFERIVGVKFLKEDEMPKDFNTIKNPSVLSYCDAFRLINTEKYTEGIIVTKDSIKICHWSPVGLGLQEPETDVQKKIVPLFDELNHGIFIFNIGKTSKDHPLQNYIDNPDTVTLVGTPENVAKSVEEIGLENFTKDYINQFDLSAVSLYLDEDTQTKKEKRKIKRHLRNIKFTNWLFASKLISNKPMAKFLTKMLTKYTFVKIMDGLLEKSANGMSCCYGASSIPYATQKANVNLMDTGSIGWGELSKENMFLGLSYSMYKTFEPNILQEK